MNAHICTVIILLCFREFRFVRYEPSSENQHTHIFPVATEILNGETKKRRVKLVPIWCYVVFIVTVRRSWDYLFQFRGALWKFDKQKTIFFLSPSLSFLVSTHSITGGFQGEKTERGGGKQADEVKARQIEKKNIWRKGRAKRKGNEREEEWEGEKEKE